MATRSGPPRGVSSLPSGRGARLRSRPADRGPEQGVFKIYLLLREKEREAQFRNALLRSLRRNLANDEQIERRIRALMNDNPFIELPVEPTATAADPGEDARSERPARSEPDGGAEPGRGGFPRTVVDY